MNTPQGFDVVRAISELKREDVLKWVKLQLEQEISPDLIIQKLTAGLEELGDRFASGNCYIPELMMGGTVFQEAMALLEPKIEAEGIKIKKIGSLLIGTVKGDLHDLGQNLVSVVFASGGFEVISLGKDVSTDTFVKEVGRNSPDILGLSSLLTTTMEGQRQVIESLTREGLRDKVKILVGGAPVNQAWADEIGADGYGSDAVDGLRKARVFLGLK